MASGVYTSRHDVQSQILQTLHAPESQARLADIVAQEALDTRVAVGRRVCAEFGFVDARGTVQLAGCLKALTDWRRWGGLCCRAPGAGVRSHAPVSRRAGGGRRGGARDGGSGRGVVAGASRRVGSGGCGIPCCTSSIRAGRPRLPAARCAIWSCRRTGCSARSDFRRRRCTCGRARRGWGGALCSAKAICTGCCA